MSDESKPTIVNAGGMFCTKGHMKKLGRCPACEPKEYAEAVLEYRWGKGIVNVMEDALDAMNGGA